MPRVKLVDIVQDKIKDMIVNGEYDSNGYLPSEGELTIKFDVSRATVREAVRSMEIRGFVERIHGKGVKVLDKSTEVITRSIADMITKGDTLLDDLLEMRVILEPGVSSLAARNRTDEEIKLLAQYVEIMENSESMDDAYYEADLSFHTTLAACSKNKMIASFISAYNSILRELIVLSSKADTPIEKQFHFHHNILDTIIKKDEFAAEKAMQEHIAFAFKNKANQYQTV